MNEKRDYNRYATITDLYQICVKFKLPGGHGMHPSAPWEVILENVPTGHGKKNLEYG